MSEINMLFRSLGEAIDEQYRRLDEISGFAFPTGLSSDAVAYMQNLLIAIRDEKLTRVEKARDELLSYVFHIETQLAATQARLAGYEEGFDPVVHPAPDKWVLMKNCDDEFIPVQWDSKAEWYWNYSDGESFDYWYDDNIDLRKWFPWLGSKGGEA